MTHLHAGGSIFNQNCSYKSRGDCQRRRRPRSSTPPPPAHIPFSAAGHELFMRFLDGVPEAQLAECGPCPRFGKTGTTDRQGSATWHRKSQFCRPSTSPRSSSISATLEASSAQLAFYISGTSRLACSDVLGYEPKILHLISESGHRTLCPLSRTPPHQAFASAPHRDPAASVNDILLEVAMEWTDTIKIPCCASQTDPQKDGVNSSRLPSGRR